MPGAAGRSSRQPAVAGQAARTATRGRGEPPPPSYDNALFGGPQQQQQGGRGRLLFRRPLWAATDPGVPPPNVAGGWAAINRPREVRDEELAGPQFERMQTRSRTRGSSSSSGRGSSAASRGSSRTSCAPSSRPLSRPQQAAESPRPRINLRMGDPPAQENPPSKRARVRVSPPPPPPPPSSMGPYSPTSPDYRPSPRRPVLPLPPPTTMTSGSYRQARRTSASPSLFVSPVS